MVPRRARRVFHLPLGVLILVALTGCVGRDPGAMRVVDGVLEVAVCKDIRVDEVAVSVVKDRELLEMWAAKGVSSLTYGQVIVYGVPPVGLTTRTLEESVGLEGEVLNVYLSASGRGSAWILVAEYEDLREDLWRNEDGEYVEQPCA